MLAFYLGASEAGCIGSQWAHDSPLRCLHSTLVRVRRDALAASGLMTAPFAVMRAAYVCRQPGCANYKMSVIHARDGRWHLHTSFLASLPVSA